MPEITYIGPAVEQDYGELMTLLDAVFFLDDDEPRRDFLTLLPKLYKREYAPWANNYILKEDGAIKAAVGMYVYDAVIAGRPCRMGGIGNVAVDADCRRNGYMRLTMDAAMQAMSDAGCAFGILGGQRQRYGYWGFEKGGWELGGSFNRSNLRHMPEIATDLKPEPLTGPADLKLVQSAHERDLLHTRHDASAFYDVLCSWDSKPHILRDGKGVAAYFCLNREKDEIGNLRLLQPERFHEIFKALIALLPLNRNGFGVDCAPWDTELIACLEKYGEGYSYDTSGTYAVLCWGSTLSLLLPAQGQLKPLPDGSVTALIHGQCGDETLRISVTGGQPSVAATADAPDFELDRLEAVRFFTHPFCQKRVEIAARFPCLNSWLPLPMCWRGYDHV